MGRCFSRCSIRRGAARSAANIVVVAVRLEDFGGAADGSVASELVSAIASAHDASAAVFVVCLCPSSPGVREAFADLESDIAHQLAAYSRVRVVGAVELLRGFEAVSWHDTERNQLGHVPFTPEFFARLATAVARRAFGVLVPQRKVIALDGDNTLWRGIVGEDGVEGVTLDDNRREIQQFLVEQQQAGMLLCLCSKNNESDVHELFERRGDMPLRLDHFVATRINWERKSEGLRSLASELSLGLDSFVFVDDSPVEISEVASALPEVLCIQLPADASALDVLRDTWALDHWVVTKEDRDRTAMYQQGRARDAVKRTTMSLDAFIAELGVDVRIAPMEAAQLPRASQLTHRTNQFNTTTIRRTEGELAALSAAADSTVLVAQVRDRFGDYGLTGLVVAKAAGKALNIDTFLLSCRVLGRGVEQRIIEELSRIAAERGLDTIEFPFVRTKRNAPAEQFLVRFGSEYRTDTADGFVVRLPAAAIAALNAQQPSIEAPAEDAPPARSTESITQNPPEHADVSARAARLRELSGDSGGLVRALAAARRRPRPSDAAAPVSPTSDDERALVALWSELLGVQPMGVDDNFLAFGGDSLLGTLLLSRIRATLGVSLPIRALFEAPTPRQLAAWMAGIPAAQRLAGRSIERAIPVLGAGAPVPMSRGQVRLWVMDRLDGATSALNVPTAFAITGGVDTEALRRALVEIMHRHHVLRSTFTERDGAPHLTINPLGPSILSVRSVATDAEAERLLNAEASRPFDLAAGPLMRALLVSSSSERHHLIVTMHHIVSDGWSQGVMVRELSVLYEAFARGAASPLAPLNVQFGDVVAWGDAEAKARDSRADREYWRANLAGAPALSVPTDRPRPATATSRGGHVSFAWSEETARQVRELSLRLGVTPFITLLAAWYGTLHRFSGQDDVVIGSAVANRQHADAEPLIGFFVNTLALRIRTAPQTSFEELVAHVRNVVLTAQDHALPFDEVVDAVRPPVEASRNPLFHAALVLQNRREPPLALAGASTELVTVETAGSQVDLQLSLGESAAGVTGTLEYNADLFDRFSAEQLAESMRALLESALSDSARSIETLPLLTDAQASLLSAFGGAGGEHPEFLAPLFHTMFEEWAERTPDAVAVRCDGEQLTYAQLNARANRVAHALRAAGVGIESLVGLCVDRSLELTIGTLGILKAGAAYVPMDPRYPAERLRFMLEDSAAAVVLTSPESRAAIERPGVRVIDVQDAIASGASDANPDVPVGPRNLAYVIYTSGSTGRPKGTLIEHLGLANLSHYAYRVFGAEACQRVLQFASPSFDASVVDLATTLPHGTTLIVPTSAQVQAWPVLLELLRAERVTMTMLPPALLRATTAESLPDLNSIVVAGDASSRELVDAWARDRTLWTGYGPTEVTVAASYGVCRVGDSRPPAIGIPVANSRAYVVGASGQLVPPGMPGELWVAGAGLARGYLHRPETTAERFVMTSFAGVASERAYRTGDLVRWRDDGNLEFIGRIDDQVKIRGHRVELGEVEAAVLGQPGVRDAVVIAREDDPGDKRLVAYVVGEATDDLLRSALSRALPEYMLPSAFVHLERFPLSPNGKVDRKALPKPDLSVSSRGSTYVAPRNDVERAIAAVWSQVLKVQDVGVHDDFFELGGDSILSIQVLSRCVKSGIALTARQLFLTPTIAQLAESIQSSRPVAPVAMVEEAVPEGEVQLTPIQRWFFALDLPDVAYWNQAFLFTVPASIDADRMERALVRVAERHDALRLRYRKSGGTWKQVYGAAANLTLERFDLRDAEVNDRQARIEEIGVEVQESLHLSRGPLAAAAHITFGDNEPGRLLIVAHHLVIDGVSWRILMEDLEAAYVALAEQRAIALPARTTSYQRWSEKLNALGSTPLSDAAASHWRSLRGARTQALAVTGAAASNTERDAETVSATLSPAETESLVRALPAATGATVHEALLAALGVALCNDADARDVAIDVEGHGREALFADADVSRTVGWFTSVYPVLVPARAGWAEALDAVKQHVRAVPERGADYLARRASLGDVPQPDLVFNYLGQFDQVVAGSALFAFARESTGAWHAASSARPYAHEVGAIVRGGRLELTWTFNANAHDRAAVDAALSRLVSALRAMIGGRSGADDSAYPLSPIQQGLLFHALSAPDSSAYQIQSTWTLRGPLNVDAYRRAWQALLNRHSILRTQFVWEGVEQSAQAVIAAVALPWRFEDWRQLDAVAQAEQLASLRLADQAERFDLGVAPLTRVTVVRLADDVHEVVWSFHHMLLDGWSGALVKREVAALYAALAAGREPVLPAVRPYRDYIAQLSRTSADAERYWRARLAGVTAPTSLGIDHKRIGEEAADFHEAELSLTPAATAALRTLARDHRVTLNVVMQAAWAIVLRCYSGEDDVVFGETVTNRPIALDGVEHMVGLFLNTLPARVTITPDASVGDLLRAIQREQADKSAHETAALADIQHWSQFPRGTPPFDSLVVFENYPTDDERPQSGGITVHDFKTVERTHYPLTLTVIPGSALLVRAMYDARRFDGAAIERTLEHLQAVLASLATDPARAVRDVDVLAGSPERNLVVRTWNDTAVSYPGRDATLVSLVSEQVARTPDAVAVEDERVQLTYRQLDACASALAADLVNRGATGSLVGVCAERSVELVIALLAVVKAGGAYVPIDAGYPPDRVAFMLADSDVPVLLTTRALADAVPALAARAPAIVWLDDAASPPRSPLPSLPHVRADDAAYMIYTSGSTGRPKGALNAHRGIVNRVLWMQSEYQLTGADVVLQKTPFSFDVSVWEFFWPLITGARIVMARPEGHRDPGYLAEVITQRGVTVCHFVPSMLRAFLAEPSARRCVTLRDVMASGEALPPDVVSLFNSRLPAAQLHNLYGPTECAVDVSYWPCPRGNEELDLVPIGRPVANTTLYVLDPAMRPVPIGVPGELFIGGVQVGMGYHNRPELTAERFVTDPFSAGARLYRTGDRARWQADGTIEYLGRVDFQVKVRGYRIELGEIEAVLSQHASVNDVVVVVRSDNAGEQRLVAYVVLDRNDAAIMAELRRHVGERLPDYMVPSVFVVLDALPLSSNGKVDRRQLPEPEDSASATREYTAPRNAAEETLCRIWQAVLRRDAVGVHDNFFELGGDSILSIQIASRARDAGLPLTVASLRKYPTVAEQAAAAVIAAPVVAEARATGAAPLTPIQSWFLDLDVADASHWNQAFAFEAREAIDADRLRRALDLVMEHHDALRLRFTRTAGGWQQCFSEPAADVPFTVERIASNADYSAQFTEIAERAQASLDIERGPLLRVVLVSGRETGRSVVLVVVHHLAVDGVSWRILADDLEQAYRTGSLPARSASYQRWANGLVAFAGSDSLHRELPWWREVTQSPARTLPVDRSRTASNTVGESRTITVSLSADETADLLKRVPAAYATQVNDILLTALSDALSPWVGAGELLIDMEGHGREDIGADADFSRTVGWFTSLFPFRLPVGVAGDAGTRIRTMKERVRAIPRHGIGYGVLRYLAAGSNLANAPAPEVIFNYLGQFGGDDGALFHVSEQVSVGSWVSPRGRRPHLLALNALVLGGRLQFNWTYGSAVHEQGTIETVAERMLQAVSALTRHCLTPGVGGRTPSDFPLATLTQAEVDALAGTGEGIEDVLAVAPLQELFLATAGTASEHGFEQQRIDIAGMVDADAMRAAWHHVVARHQMLRSEFASALESGSAQVVRRGIAMPFQVTDLRNASADARATRIVEIETAERARGFDASRAPLMRVHLVRTGTASHTLIWSHHHLLLDRWSIPLILAEVGAAYHAFSGGGAPVLPTAPRWSAYVAWLASRDRVASEQFWSVTLGGTDAVAVPMLAGAGGNDGETELILGDADTAAIAALARERRTTVNAIVSAAWAMWLARATGRSDVTFGLAVAVRPEELPGVRNLVGMCINNVPARVNIGAGDSTDTVISRTSAQLDASAAHAHVALTDIQRLSGLPWHQRVFDTLVVFHHQDDDAVVSSWLGAPFSTSMTAGEMQTNYPLTLVVGGGRALRLRLAWQGRWAGESAAEQVLTGVASALREMVLHPSLPAMELIGRLPEVPVAAVSASARDLTPARTDTEWMVALIWSELLGLHAIGVHENFFALGGQSLVATQILSRTHDAFQMALPISLLFEHPTVAAFAAALTSREPMPGQTERIAAITRRVEEMSVAELREAGVHD